MPVKYRQNNIKKSNNHTAWLLYFYSLPYLFSIIVKLLNGEIINLVLVASVFVGVVLAATWMTTGLKNKENYLIENIQTIDLFL